MSSYRRLAFLVVVSLCCALPARADVPARRSIPRSRPRSRGSTREHCARRHALGRLRNAFDVLGEAGPNRGSSLPALRVRRFGQIARDERRPSVGRAGFLTQVADPAKRIPRDSSSHRSSRRSRATIRRAHLRDVQHLDSRNTDNNDGIHDAPGARQRLRRLGRARSRARPAPSRCMAP